MANYSNRARRVSLPTTGEDAYRVLATAHDQDVRRRIYMAGRQAPEQRIAKLEALFRTRAGNSEAFWLSELRRDESYRQDGEIT